MQCIAADDFATCPKDVLIVEDDPLLALDFEDRLLRLGVQSVRSAGTVATALDLIAGRAPDFALLDVGLFSEKSFAVAERLTALKIPFAFVTGYGERSLPDRYRDRPALQKPFQAEQLSSALADLLAA